MKNNLYLTEADSDSFDEWFAEGYCLFNQEQERSAQLCKNVTIVVTEDCNFDCTYCYMHGKTPKTMSSKTAHDREKDHC